jgi:hypothetical protein
VVIKRYGNDPVSSSPQACVCVCCCVPPPVWTVWREEGEGGGVFATQGEKRAEAGRVCVCVSFVKEPCFCMCIYTFIRSYIRVFIADRSGPKNKRGQIKGRQTKGGGKRKRRWNNNGKEVRSRSRNAKKRRTSPKFPSINDTGRAWRRGNDKKRGRKERKKQRDTQT